MKRICSWCAMDMGEKDGSGVTHGMCEACFAKIADELDAREKHGHDLKSAGDPTLVREPWEEPPAPILSKSRKRLMIPIAWKVRFILNHEELISKVFSDDHFNRTIEARKEVIKLAMDELGYSPKTAYTDILRSLNAARYWIKNAARRAFILSEPQKNRLWIERFPL